MGQTYVYLDVVFLINLLMDYAILWATARFGQLAASRKRLFAGALIGATYCIALLIPGLTFLYGLVFRLLLSLIIIGVAFAPLTLSKFLRACGYFYLIAFCMGGAILGSLYLLSSNPELFMTVTRMVRGLTEVPAIWLLAGIVVAVILGKWGAALIRRTINKAFFRVPLTISIEGQNLTIPALLDTGNQLKDPLTQAPVVIAEYAAVETFLPPELKEVFQRSPELDLKSMAEELSKSLWSSRFRLIPFSSIGKHHGMLLGLRPDEVSIQVEDRKVVTQNVVVGIYNKPLCPQGSYRALLHPDLLESAVAIG